MGFITYIMDRSRNLTAPVLMGDGLALDESPFLGSLFNDLLTLLSNRVVLFLLALVVVYRVYQLLFQPLYHIRRNHHVGYLPEPRQSASERANEVRRRRKTGDLPPVFPNGWFRLMDSVDLPVKGVKQVSCLGVELAVFRTESGQVGVLDAYCPHLGANLAAGGIVKGDSIECPFHGWNFNCEGTCTKIPYAEKVPAIAKTKKYQSLELNQQILLWHDAEGREPFWFPPEIPEINSGRWTFRGKTQHFINAHIQEVPENAADVAHLDYLHGPGLPNGTDLRSTQTGMFNFIRHHWTASWEPEKEEDKKHMSVLNLSHNLTVFGMPFNFMHLDVKATQIGPGLVYLTWESFFGKGAFLQGLTPVEPLLQDLTHTIFCEPKIPTFIAKIFMLGEARQVERDVMVWNNKTYQKKPLLVPEDSLIAKHRRWYSQFYSENSPTFSFMMKKSLAW
eukprot:m.107689 g.107689  ORF g.107689 m.107689 type:complete len:449 (-) comp22591_c0_seq4:206-1552(-)